MLICHISATRRYVAYVLFDATNTAADAAIFAVSCAAFFYEAFRLLLRCCCRAALPHANTAWRFAHALCHVYYDYYASGRFRYFLRRRYADMHFRADYMIISIIDA